MDTNLKLYLPFDDPDGSVAADFSTNRNDATLSDGAGFSKDAMRGKSLSLNGGEAQTDYAIPFSSDFTVSMFICPKENKLGWLLNFSGVDNYKEQWLDVLAGTWYFLAFVRNGSSFRVYLDGQCVAAEMLSANPVGLSVNEPGFAESQSLLDDFKVFNKALTAKELLTMQRETDVEYYINGKNFKTFGVEVSDSSGIVGQLEKKDGLTVDWDDYHGKVRDTSRPRYKERTIQLSCFIEGVGRSEFLGRLQEFLAEFDTSGTQRLKVEYDGPAKPLVFEVFQKKAADVTKKWVRYNRELMVGTFKLELEEDEPVKRVLRYVAAQAESQVSVGFTSNRMLSIYWGDGTRTVNVSGSSQTVTHTYAQAGEYDIIIAGVIEDITSFTTNAILVWDKLK